MSARTILPIEFSPMVLGAVSEAPSPLPRMVLRVLMALLVVLAVLVVFGKVDQVSVARGRLVPTSYVQVVQPAHGGVVREVLVHGGDRVEKGDLMIRLDSSVAQARVREVSAAASRVTLNLARVRAELDGVSLELPPHIDPALGRQVEAQYRANRAAHRTQFEQQQASVSVAGKEERATAARVEELAQSLVRLRQEEEAIDKMLAKGYVSRLQALQKERERIAVEQQLVAERERLRGAADRIVQENQRLASVVSEYHRLLEQEAAELGKEQSQLIAALVEAEEAASSTALRAPASGVVKDVGARSIGAVLQAGEVIVTLVPEHEALRAEVWVENSDIDRVREGLPVRLKVDALDFRRDGPLSGVLIHVGPDASNRAEGSPRGESSEDARGEESAAYRALISVDAAALDRRLGRTALSAGMTVTAEIVAGQRTVLDYLLSPIVKVAREAGQEP